MIPSAAQYDGEILYKVNIDSKDMTSQILSAQNRVEKLGRKMSEISKKMKELENTKIPTEEYKLVEKELTNLYGKLNSVNDRMQKWQELGKGTNSNAFKSMELDAQKLKASIEELNASKAKMESAGTAYKSGTETEEYQKLSAQYADYSAQMQIAQAKHSEILSKMKQETQETGKLAGAANRVRKGFSNIGSAIGKAREKLKNLHSSTKQANKGFSNLLRTMKQMVLSMAVFQIMSKGMEFLKSGLQNLAVYSKEYNKTMSDFTSSTAQLKNSFAVAFAPILNAVIPILTQLINKLSAAGNALSKFFAILSGKSTYTKAIKQNKNYASSLNGVSKSADKAKGSLAGFDDLDVLDKSGSDSSGGSSGSSGADGSGFKEESIGEISDWTKNFKDAIEAGDWFSVGSLLAQKVNDALSSIDWAFVQEKTKGFATNLATGLNGFVAGLDWTLVGQTIGNGINTAIYTAQAFIKTFDWSTFGQSIGNGITGAINTIDWAATGDTGGSLVTGLFSTLKGIFDNTDWKSLGSGIISGIGAFFSAINWGEISGTIYSAISGFYKFLTGVIQGIDWGETLHYIIDSIGDFFAGIDYKDTAKSIGEFLGAAFKSAIDLAGSLWDLCKEAWGDVSSYFEGYIDEAGGNIILGLWNGITDALANAGKWIYENILEPFIKGFKDAFGIHSPSKVMKEMGGYIIDGLKEGLGDIWGKVKEKFTRLKENVAGTFSNIRKDAVEKWSSIKEKVSGKAADLKESLTEKFQNIRENIQKKWDKVKSDAEDAWSGIKKPFSDVAGWFKEKFSDAWEKVRGVFSDGGDVFGGIKDGILESFKKIVNALIDGINDVVRKPFDGLNAALNKIRGVSVAGIKPFEKLIKENAISVPQIPKLANGGITTGSTLANIGEAGREAVLPLENNLSYLEPLADMIAEKIPPANNAPVYLQVDGKTFARLMNPYSQAEQNRIGLSFT